MLDSGNTEVERTAEVDEAVQPIVDDPAGTGAAPARPHRRSPWIRRGAALALVAAGVSLGAVMITDPEALDGPVGDAKVAANRVFAETAVEVGLGPRLGYTPDPYLAEESVSGSSEGSDSWWSRITGSGRSGYLPEVTLGGPGGERELDECTGEFTEMVDYQAPGVAPLYSAHNTCDGDLILGWSIGQRATVAGSDQVYEVVEERQAMTGDDAGVLDGMAGEMVLQTCFYGEERMRFLALAPVGQPGM